MRNMQLAIDAESRAVGIDNSSGIEISPVCRNLEDRDNDDDLEFLSERRERGCRFPGHFFREMGGVNLFVYGEVPRSEQLLKADHASSPARRLTNTTNRFLQVRFEIGRDRRLNQGDADRVLLHCVTEENNTDPVQGLATDYADYTDMSVELDQPQRYRTTLAGTYTHRQPEVLIRLYVVDVEVRIRLKIIPAEHSVVSGCNTSHGEGPVRPGDGRAISIQARAQIPFRDERDLRTGRRRITRVENRAGNAAAVGSDLNIQRTAKIHRAPADGKQSCEHVHSGLNCGVEIEIVRKIRNAKCVSAR